MEDYCLYTRMDGRMQHVTYFLGVDAGGTNTYSVITDAEGVVVGVGRSGNGNHQLNRQEAERNIRYAVEEALEAATLCKQDITYSWFGLAGADRKHDLDILQPMIEKLGLPRYSITCDTLTALRAGTSNPYGVVIICGTGVNCAGVNPAGVYYQCGGFGYLYGDFGGGGGLAIEVYRAVIQAWDGRGEQTLLTTMLLEQQGYDSVEEMYHDYLDNQRRVPADVARLLFTAAEARDLVAKNLLSNQGKALGVATKAVINQLQMKHIPFDIVLAGSVLTRGRSNIIEREIKRIAFPIAHKSNLVYLDTEPVVGALLLAMDKVNHPITKEVEGNLTKMTEMEGM